jgi:hypothetical protein
MDSRTGKPLDVEYAFKGGKGTSTIRRSDGKHCTAPTTADMQKGALVIEQTEDVVCPDGQVFGRSRVECRSGKDGGRAECRGMHAEGGGYRVDIGR